jgi:formylglycine-generating enzyme required for sulfatase activity
LAATLPPLKKAEIINSIGMKLMLVPAGRFFMGSPSDETKRMQREGPLHEVEITKPFYLGAFQVTQAEYESIVGNNPSRFSPTGKDAEEVEGLDTRRFPVEQVNWEDAVEFCRLLSEKPAEKHAGRVYRLPTEAEWEYAARGGVEGKDFIWGDEMYPGGEPAANTWQGQFPWRHTSRHGPRTMPVGSFAPNGFGLYDMAGNVWEWTSDWFVFDRAAVDSPCCAANSRDISYDPCQPNVRIPRKVLKGGSFLCSPEYCLRFRPAARSPQMIDTGMSHLGFRCVKD